MAPDPAEVGADPRRPGVSVLCCGAVPCALALTRYTPAAVVSRGPGAPGVAVARGRWVLLTPPPVYGDAEARALAIYGPISTGRVPVPAGLLVLVA